MPLTMLQMSNPHCKKKSIINRDMHTDHTFRPRDHRANIWKAQISNIPKKSTDDIRVCKSFSILYFPRQQYRNQKDQNKQRDIQTNNLQIKNLSFIWFLEVNAE